MGFGDSGLLRADSSQLDFVGLHLRGSIVLDGLVGGEASSPVSEGVAWSACLSPWLELGLDVGVTEPSLSMLPTTGRERALAWPGRGGCSTLLRLDTAESTRCSPPGELTLHLLTLSDRFIMALCTNPPMPFVGERGRVGEARPVGVAAGWRSGEEGSDSPAASPVGGSRRGTLVRDSGEPNLSRDVASDDSGGGSEDSFGGSQDMPGSCARRLVMSKVSWSST